MTPGLLWKQVVVFDGTSEFVEFAESRGNVQTRNRSTKQRGNVGMLVVTAFVRSFAYAFVRTGALALWRWR